VASTHFPTIAARGASIGGRSKGKPSRLFHCVSTVQKLAEKIYGETFSTQFVQARTSSSRRATALACQRVGMGG